MIVKPTGIADSTPGFWLRRLDGRLGLMEDLAIHLIELPTFRKGLGELEKPLDQRPYFRQNGDKLDVDALPSRLVMATLPDNGWPAPSTEFG